MRPAFAMMMRAGFFTIATCRFDVRLPTGWFAGAVSGCLAKFRDIIHSTYVVFDTRSGRLFP